MNKVRMHNAPFVIMKTGGLAAGITAAATVGLLAVAVVTAAKIADTAEYIKTRVDKFLGEEPAPKKEPSKEVVKDTLRNKAKRVISKSFLKNLFK